MAKIIGIFIGWMVIISLTICAGIKLFAYQPTFPYATELINAYQNRFLTTLAQFDGVHYLTIAEKGYQGTGLIQAFFPLYPLMIRWFSFGILNEITIGIIISTLSFLGALYFLYRLISLDESKTVAEKSLVGLMLFPTAFFFIALYTESLFLLLIVTSFYAARRKKWWLAGCLGVIAGTTRLVGVFLFPGLVYEYWLQNRQKISLNVIFCIGPLLGLMGYMAYLWIVFGDPLLFYHVQADFGAGRTNTGLVLLPQVFFRYMKMLLTTSFKNPIYPVLIQEFVSGICGLAWIIISWFKTRKSYVVYAVGAFVLPTLTGTFSSMPRYLLPIFPLYIVMAKYLPKKYYIVVITVFTIMFVYNLVRFTQGLWVA